MSILTANLKHLYQRCGLWLVYLFLSVFAAAIVADFIDHPRTDQDQGEYIGLTVLAFGVGFVVATMFIDILTKPFSYCLPGHRRVLRKCIFLVAAPVCYLCSMFFIAYPGLNSWQLHIVFCSAVFASLTFYFLGAALAFAIKNSIVVAALFIPLAMTGKSRLGLHVIIERAIVGYPYAVICVGGLSGAVLWLWLGRANLARRYCNARWIGFFDGFNRKKRRRFNQSGKWSGLKDHPRPWVDRFFLGRMDKYEYFGAGRYWWGVLYKNFAMAVSRWKLFVVGLILLTIMSGYMIQWMILAIILPPLAVFGHQRPPAYSSMLIFGGRRQRFASTAVLCVFGIAVASAVVLIMVGVSSLLAGFMPEIARIGINRRFVFHIIDARFVFVPLVVAPFVLTLRLVFYNRKPVYFMLVFMLLMCPMMMALIMPPGSGLRESARAVVTDPTSVFGIAVVGWAVFFLVLSHICYERCLVGQGRSR